MPAIDQKPGPGARLNQAHPLGRGLVACWLLNDLTAGMVNDSVNPFNVGLLTNTPAPHPLGVKFTSDGSTGAGGTRINVANTAPFALSAFTLEVWWEADTVSAYNGPFCNRVASQAGFQYAGDIASSVVHIPHLVILNSSGTETNQFKGTTSWTPPFGKPKQFVWTWDGTTANLYVDGVNDSASTSTTTGYSGTSGVVIGKGYTGIGGVVPKVSVYDHALTPSEVGQLYVSPYGMFTTVRRRAFKKPASTTGVSRSFYGVARVA